MTPNCNCPNCRQEREETLNLLSLTILTLFPEEHFVLVHPFGAMSNVSSGDSVKILQHAIDRLKAIEVPEGTVFQ